VTSVSCGTTLVYNPYFPTHKTRLGTKISEFVRTSVPSYELKVKRLSRLMCSVLLPSRLLMFVLLLLLQDTDKLLYIVVLTEDEEGNDVEIPDPVILKFKH
jgi:hypothetical protein